MAQYPQMNCNLFIYFSLSYPYGIFLHSPDHLELLPANILSQYNYHIHCNNSYCTKNQPCIYILISINFIVFTQHSNRFSAPVFHGKEMQSTNEITLHWLRLRCPSALLCLYLNIFHRHWLIYGPWINNYVFFSTECITFTWSSA